VLGAGPSLNWYGGQSTTTFQITSFFLSDGGLGRRSQRATRGATGGWSDWYARVGYRRTSVSPGSPLCLAIGRSVRGPFPELGLRVSRSHVVSSADSAVQGVLELVDIWCRRASAGGIRLPVA